jgi:hypothetical protein
MAVNTLLRIVGCEVVLPKETALKVYDLLTEQGVYVFQRYSTKDTLTPLSSVGHLNMEPLHHDFEKDVKAAQALGVPYAQFDQQRPN